MQNKWFKVVALCVLTVGVFANAEEGTTQATVASPMDNVIANIDLRPTYKTKKGSVGTENYYELGYKLSKDSQVSFAHGINTNLYRDARAGKTGFDARSDFMFVRAKFNNLWQSADEQWALGYQPRFYIPHRGADFDKGMVTTWRNYFNLSRKVGSATLIASYIPVIHAFSKASFQNAANPNFENRLYLIASMPLSSKWSLSVPLFFIQKHYRDAGVGVGNSNAWSYNLSTWPELLYAVNENISVGAGFYSDNMLKSDFSGFQIGKGLEDGAAQLILQASL